MNSKTRIGIAVRRAGVAAIRAGALVFAGQAGELVLGSPSDLVDAVFVALWVGGVVALGLAFAGLRTLLRFLAHVIVISPLRRLPVGRGWVLPLVALAGGVAATVDIDPAGCVPSLHDIFLFVFEGAWIAFGVVLLRRADSSTRPD